MPMLDRRGRLGGRFNPIDIVVAGFVVLVIPAGFIAYRALRDPTPIMTTVTPARLAADGTREIRVAGRHLRPFLRAFVSKTGVPLTPEDQNDDRRARYLIQTQEAFVLELPRALPPGDYDLYLFDEGREAAHLNSAFTLTPPAVRRTDLAAGPTATFDMGVRFALDPGLLPLVKVGDTDINQPGSGATSAVAASLVSLRRLPQDSPQSVRLPNGTTIPVLPPTFVQAAVRLSAVRRQNVWEYTGPQRLRVGEAFAFATTGYVIFGTITSIAPASERVSREGSSR